MLASCVWALMLIVRAAPHLERRTREEWE
jgi:hypothetical protein